MKSVVKSSSKSKLKLKDLSKKDRSLLAFDMTIKYIESKILKLNMAYDKAIITTTELFIQMGYEHRRLKNLLKDKGIYFEKYCDNKFPHIKERKRQRCMKLSEAVDLKEHSDLKYIPITTLETLATNRRDRSIGKLLIEKHGFMDLNQLSDEPTAKAISDFKKKIHNVVASYNSGCTEIEGNQPNDSNKLRKQGFNKTKRPIEARKSRELMKNGLIDFEHLQTGVNRCFKILTKYFNRFLNNEGKFYDRKTHKQMKEGNHILILNTQDLKDFVNIFKKILKSNMVKANDSESNLLKDIENDF